MKKSLLCAAFAALSLLIASPPASATAFTYAFCSATTNPTTPVAESGSCLPGLGAALRITDELPGLDPADPNDFWVLLAVSTRASDGFDTGFYTGIDKVQFDTPYKTGDYEDALFLDHSLVSGAFDWTAYFGQVSGPNCPSGNSQDKSVCGKTVADGGFTDTGDIDIWAFKINLLDSIVNPFAANTELNMRVSFLPSHNLSPSGTILPPGTPTPFDEDPPPSAVPEPASLMLLGTGLAAVGARVRRRRQSR